MGVLRHSYFLQICKLSYMKTVLSARFFLDNYKGKRDKTVMRKPNTLVADFFDTCKYKPRAISAEQRVWARQLMIKQNNSK